MDAFIRIRGAREHNLKGVNLDIPRNKLVVLTGLSGSGKSSLAFDTIYAEGQRRYLESLSSYARQFLEKLKKPEVDYISGLSPSIAIEQRSMTHNPRSTVATVTEIYDYLRLLYAKAGDVFCHVCGVPLTSQRPDEISRDVLEKYAGKEIQVFAPVVRGRKGEFQKLFQDTLKRGFSQGRIDGKMTALKPDLKLRKTHRHDIEILTDHLRAEPKNASRLLASIQAAVDLAGGAAMVLAVEKSGRPATQFFSTKRSCAQCQTSYPDLTPNLFSFNSPYGACPRCKGLGKYSQLMTQGVIKDPSRPLMSGALNEDLFFSFNKYFVEDLLYDLTKAYHFEPSAPFQEWPEEAREAFFLGDGEHSGLIEELERLFHETNSEEVRRKVRNFLKEDACSECGGKRLRKESLGVKIQGKNIVEVTAQAVEEAVPYFEKLKFPKTLEPVTMPILKEIRQRLKFLFDVGLGYLTLDRTVATLAGGELQRIRLAAQIGVGLTGVLYVLDEPSIGLHPRDNSKLLTALERLRDLKNTVLVVEHDEETMRRADHLIDLGPAAGRHGGEVVAEGPADNLRDSGNSLTAKYLSGDMKIEVPSQRKPYKGAPSLELRGCEEHNLKKVDVNIPLGLFVCVTGVSGSGKSTLIYDTLYKELHNRIWKTQYHVGKFKSLQGAQHLEQVIAIDQSPIGRTPRSNPATYTDLFTPIRKLFSEVHESRSRRYEASRFSFNLKGGRCETCRGEGFEKLQMSFMPDIYVQCETCRGKRYNDATLEVRYRGKNIAEVLDLTVQDAIEFFSEIAVIKDKLVLLETIGLGYLKLGQSCTTLSGGEAQRIKLAYELAKRSSGKTLYLLDEPTTGLHFADIANLLTALFRLRDQGNTIVVIEHNLDMIKTADYILDLGPEGGKGGGQIIATGSPEEIAACRDSYTGAFLKSILSSAKPGR
ncbi:MAG TPA: excinuclease ABC subunit UvrA [Verrucomicrobiae bacterium]|jgi:excinuclease ABC subunit A|nr:excinuclease ABC subunit UvrA [Verrucomicrobiae bacterium]